MAKKRKVIGMFGGASDLMMEEYYKLAYLVGQRIRKEGWDLCTGAGSTGMMAEIVDGYKSVKMKFPGRVIGVTTKHLSEYEGVHEDIDEVYIVESMNSRKHMLISLSDIIIALPGGFGTMDELTEVFTLRQIGLLDTPILIVDNTEGRWTRAVNILKRTMIQIGSIPRTYNKAVQFCTAETVTTMIKKVFKDGDQNVERKF